MYAPCAVLVGVFHVSVHMRGGGQLVIPFFWFPFQFPSPLLLFDSCPSPSWFPPLDSSGSCPLC